MSLRHSALTLLAVLALALLAAAPAAASASPGTYLVMPVYTVDSDNPSGLTSLWAVRNATTSPIDLKVQYFAATMATAPEATEKFDLDPGATMTRNLRDVVHDLGVPDFGWVRFIAFKNGSAAQVLPKAIYGDYFFVDPANAFAGGSELLRDHVAETNLGMPSAPQHDLCSKVATRSFSGGIWTGGTDFGLHAEWDVTAGFTNPIAVAQIRDEAGHLLGTCNINAPPHGPGMSSYSMLTNTAILTAVCPDMPTYGSIVWTFATGVRGHVMAWYKANGLYSVAVASACLKE